MSTPANDASTGAPAGFLKKKDTLRLVYYNVLLMLLLGAGLYFVVSAAATAQADQEAEVRKEKIAARRSAESVAALNTSRSQDLRPAADSVSGEAVAASDSGASSGSEQVPELNPETETPLTDPRMIAYVLFAITMAGGLGGALCNLRGIFEFTRDNQGMFPAHLELAFYLRPVSGVLCGLFTFFVSTFFAGALSQGDGSGWRTLDGMFPYIGIAFMAGFASQEFMERLKDTARTLFGSSSSPAPEPEPEPLPEPAALPELGKTESVHIKPESGGRESVSRTTEAPQTKQQAPPRRTIPPRKMVD